MPLLLPPAHYLNPTRKRKDPTQTGPRFRTSNLYYSILLHANACISLSALTEIKR